VKRLAMSLAVVAVAGSGACAEELEYGHAEYLDSCAACHGVDGRGNGPMAGQLAKRPADLTSLADESGGGFPYWRVFAVIDGRYIVPGHGDRDMPIWGRQFLENDAKVYGPKGGEKATKERMFALTNYVRSLQRQAQRGGEVDQ
jgi:mono/diheme cytochrome c family protein